VASVGTGERGIRAHMNARAAAVPVLLALSVVALHGHVPAGESNPFVGAIGSSVALSVAAAALVVASIVFVRSMAARVGDRMAARAAAAAGGDWRVGADPRPVARPSTRSYLIVGMSVALVSEFVALCQPDRAYAPALTGVAVGLVLLGVRGYLAVATDQPATDLGSDDAEESLQRWISRTEAMIHWSETSRSDWDRRVRPVLARQFEMATKVDQRRTTEPEAFLATGMMLFGADLWPWVDPDNVVRGGAARPGPGRRRLEAILECLERV